MMDRSGALVLGDLPVWKGVQPHPGFHTMPFCLEVERGVIRLNTQAADVRPVVARYSSPDYTFMTTPPGCSEWGDRRGDWSVRALKDAVGDLTGKTVLEIGAGTLYVAKRLVQECGVRHVMVCDPAIPATEAQPQIEVVQDYFSAARFSGRRIDVVVSVNNLEHVPDPFQYLRDVRVLLEATGGEAFLIVPECARGLATGDWGLCVHEHLSYFTSGSFTTAAREAGFVVRSLKTEEDALVALLGLGDRHPAAHGETEAERLQGARMRFQESLERVQSRIEQVRRAGGRLGVHGCSAGLNNILARLGIEADPSLFLFDGDSSKAGKFLPAFDRPILHAGDPLYHSMTDVLVAAMTFYDEIRAFAITQHGIDEARIDSLTVPVV